MLVSILPIIVIKLNVKLLKEPQDVFGLLLVKQDKPHVPVTQQHKQIAKLTRNVPL